MKYANTRCLAVCTLLSLGVSIAAAQFPARAFFFGARSTFVKPGFDFDPGAFPSLASYAVVDDEVDADSAATGALVRRVAFADAYYRLRLTIGVSSTGAPGIAPLFAEYVDESQMAERLVDGATVGIFYGEERQVGNNSSASLINREFAFRRENIFVSVYASEISTGGSVDLLSIGNELDAAVAALPDVTQSVFDSLRPTVTTFSAVPMILSAYQTADLTLTATDPSALPLVGTYINNSGDVVLGSPDKYVAGSQTGVQTLSVVVSNPRLLFTTGSINFTVTP